MNRERGEGSRGRRSSAQPTPQLTEEDRIAQAIAGFRNRTHYNPLWVDATVLVKSGIWDRVKAMLTISGWPGLLTLFCDADVNDTSEFLGTLRYTGRSDENEIEYDHRGLPWASSMERVRAVFRWPAGGQTYEPRQGRWENAWRVLAPTTYKGGNSSPKDFTDPALFYLHQILSKTLFARKNADKVGQMEMGVLALLAQGKRVHWAHYFCNHLATLRANSPIACGGMVTYLLRQLHPAPVPDDHVILKGNYADWVWFRHGQHIQVTHEGEYQWIYFSNATLRPPPVARRPIGRPPGRGRGRQALVIYDPDQEEVQEEQPAPRREPRHQRESGSSRQQAAPVQDQIARQFLDTVFNSTRASILAGMEFEIAPAPAGWNMGDPIPPEYLQPRHPPGGH